MRILRFLDEYRDQRENQRNSDMRESEGHDL
jgi:hypothetical protein